MFKDLQPPEKSGLQYKCLVLILKIVYECIVLNETSLKPFSLEMKSYFPFLEMTLFTVRQISNSLGWKGVICHITPFETNVI